jgi:hypothetical protein
MTAFDTRVAFSHDERQLRIRAWLLERAILVMSGDPRWALISFGWRMASAMAGRVQVRIADFIRPRGR